MVNSMSCQSLAILKNETKVTAIKWINYSCLCRMPVHDGFNGVYFYATNQCQTMFCLLSFLWGGTHGTVHITQDLMRVPTKATLSASLMQTNRFYGMVMANIWARGKCISLLDKLYRWAQVYTEHWTPPHPFSLFRWVRRVWRQPAHSRERWERPGDQHAEGTVRLQDGGDDRRRGHRLGGLPPRCECAVQTRALWCSLTLLFLSTAMM